jgi:hypothetical protein
MQKFMVTIDDVVFRVLQGREAGPGFVTFWYKKFDLDGAIKAIGKVTSEYGRNFSFDSSFDGKTHVLIMRHESGRNASAYYSESVKAVFALLGLDCRMEENEDQVTAYVDSDSLKEPSPSPKLAQNPELVVRRTR